MKLLLIAVDGLRADLALPDAVATDPAFARPDHPGDPRFGRDPDAAPAREPGPQELTPAPSLQRLARDGSVLPMWMTPPTDSGPGWASLLTGTTHERNGIWWNEMVGHRLARCPDLLTRIWTAQPEARTMIAATWSALTATAGPGPVIQRRPAQEAVGQHLVIEAADFSEGCRSADREVTTLACQRLLHEGPDASIVYLEGVDEAGHAHGALSPGYRAAVAEIDEHIRFLMKAVAERVEKLGEQWLVAVTTDHGHKDGGGHGEDEVEVRRSFLLAHHLGPEGPMPIRWPGQTGPSLRSEQVTPLLLALLGIREAAGPEHPTGSHPVDVDDRGPTRDPRFEW